MPVITISRQYGSGGNHIASLLCDRLGYRFFDKHLMVQLGAPEDLKAQLLAADAPSEVGSERGALWRFFRNLQASSPLGQTVPAGGIETNAVLPVDVVERGIRAAYNEDNVVIVGRGGQMVLRGLPDVLHVRVVAPIEKRAETVAQFDGLPLDAARERALSHERTATAYIRSTYGGDLSDPALYDVIVNTGRLTWDAAADMIAAAVKHLAPRAK